MLNLATFTKICELKECITSKQSLKTKLNSYFEDSCYLTYSQYIQCTGFFSRWKLQQKTNDHLLDVAFIKTKVTNCSCCVFIYF